MLRRFALPLLLIGAVRCASPAPTVSSAESKPALAPLGATGSASPVRDATPNAGTSTPESASSSGAPSVTATSNPWPGVACEDATALANLRFFACTAACDRAEALACEALGDLHAVEEGEPLPSSSAGPAARAWRKACGLGVNTACEKEAQLLKNLDANCRAQVAACVVQGNALLELEGDAQRAQVDALFQRACRKGHALGCYHSAELHADWEPQAEHDPLSRAAYLRACQLGSAEGCCSALSRFEAEGNGKAAARVRREMGKIWGAGCGSGGPIVPLGPQPILELTIAVLPGASVPAQVLDASRATCHRVLRWCYASSSRRNPEATWRYVVDVAVDAQGKVGAVEPVTAERDIAPAPGTVPAEMNECLNARLHALQFEATAAPYALRISASSKPRSP